MPLRDYNIDKGGLEKPLSSVCVLPEWCPRLSRFQRIGLVSVLSVAAILVLFRCINITRFRENILSCCADTGKYTKAVESIGEESLHVQTGSADNSTRDEHKRIRYKHTQRRLPHCLIIGARKAGTRALLQFLNLHPLIQVAKKEVHFFDDEDNYEEGLEWYRRQMPYSFKDQITIEKTPAYFAYELAPERVAKMNKTIKMLVIFRNPTDRAVSDYTQLHEKRISRNKYSPSFEESAIDKGTGFVRRSYNPVKRSIYHRYLERWLEYFPLEQFLFVNGDKLVRDPVSEIRKVEQFLGLEHRVTTDFFCFNKTKGFYCMCTEKGEQCLAESKGRKHPEISPEVTDKLNRFFRPHNKKLYQMIGKDYHWN